MNGLHDIDATWQLRRVDWNEHGLQWTGVNNDDFTVLVSGGGRCCWVSMSTVWPSHSKWLSMYGKESASNFALSLNIPLQKLFGWFRRLQPWATGDWQLHHNNAPAYVSHLMQSFLAEHQITQVTQPPYSPDLAPCDFWLFPKLKSPLKGKRFQTVDEMQENKTGQLMVIERTVWGPKGLLGRGLRRHCPMYKVSCIFFNKCLYFSYYMARYLMDRLHILLITNIYHTYWGFC